MTVPAEPDGRAHGAARLLMAAAASAAVTVVAVAARSGRYPPSPTPARVAVGVGRGGLVSPTGAAPRPPAGPARLSTTTPSSPTTAVRSAPPASAPSAVVAAAFARAYLAAPAAERRAACRPYDTDALDAQLAGPSWAGGGLPPPSPARAAAVAVRSLDPVEVTPGGVGYEISATLGGAGTASLEVLEVWVSEVAAGMWRADIARPPELS